MGCPLLVLVDTLRIGLAGLPKREPRERTRLYTGNYKLHTGSVNLILNIRAGHIYPHYHVVFDVTFYKLDHMRKVRVPRNRKTW